MLLRKPGLGRPPSASCRAVRLRGPSRQPHARLPPTMPRSCSQQGSVCSLPWLCTSQGERCCSLPCHSLARSRVLAGKRGDLRPPLPSPNVLFLSRRAPSRRCPLLLEDRSFHSGAAETGGRGSHVNDGGNASKSLQKLCLRSQRDSDKLVCIPLTY